MSHVKIQPKLTLLAAKKESSELVDLTKNDGEEGHIQDDNDDNDSAKYQMSAHL